MCKCISLGDFKLAQHIYPVSFDKLFWFCIREGVRFRNYIPRDKELQPNKVIPPSIPKFDDPVAAAPISNGTEVQTYSKDLLQDFKLCFDQSFNSGIY